MFFDNFQNELPLIYSGYQETRPELDSPKMEHLQTPDSHSLTSSIMVGLSSDFDFFFKFHIPFQKLCLN